MSADRLPPGWCYAEMRDLIALDGIFVDGDWVESKDQNPSGDVRLTQLADVGDGVWRNRSDRRMTAEKAGELRCTYLQADDVLIARMPDPLGRACLFPGSALNSVTVVDVAIVRPGKSSVDSRWLMHVINSPELRSRIAEQQSGTTRKRISRSKLAALTLPVPPKEEQCRIAAEIERRLSHVEAAERSLGTAATKLEAARLALLRSAANGSLASIAGESMTDFCAQAGVPHGAVPGRPDWASVRLDHIAQVGSGSTPKRGEKRYWSGGTIPWVTSGQIVGGAISAPADRITQAALAETSVKMWPAGTLLIAMYGEGRTRGHCAELLIDATCNQACAAIALHPQFEAAKPFLKMVLQSQYEENRALGSGGVQENLNLGLIKSVVVELPPFGVQAEIVAEVDRRLSLLNNAAAVVESQLRRCTALRKSILSAAFRGEILPQDSADEPASMLLKRIRDERATAEQSKPVRTRTAPKERAAKTRVTRPKKERA